MTRWCAASTGATRFLTVVSRPGADFGRRASRVRRGSISRGLQHPG
ncbi:MAG: hypothetical protein MZV70_65480 [Desulfobacterales bacterium]|nr:hypothetical protein [Desulfobacterales bacterium]